MVKKLTDLPYVVDREVRKRLASGKIKIYRYVYFERAGDRIELPLPEDDEDEFLSAYQKAKRGSQPGQKVITKYTYSELIKHYKRFSVTPEGSKRKKGWKDLAPRTRKDYDACFEYMNRNIGQDDFRQTIRSDVREAMRSNMHRKKFANNLKQCWSILHEHAIDEGWRETNAAREVSKFKTGDGHVPWPFEMQARLWNKAGEFGELGYHVRLAMILYIDSVQRGGDILDYRWSEVEEDGINVTQNKTGTTVFVPFTDWMRDALEVERTRQLGLQLIPLPPNDYILQGPKGGKLSYNTLNDRFVKIRKDAKIPEKYKLHGFRYTGSGELGAAVGKLGMSVTGHLTEAMFQKYAGAEMRKAEAKRAQKERNKNRPERETLKPVLKPTKGLAGQKGKA